MAKPVVLVLMKGHPGVGKSTLARHICKDLGWPLIDKDDAKDILQTLPAEVLQSFDANQLSYDITFSYCQTQLLLGISTVVDCPLARSQLYDQAVNIAAQCGAAVAVVDCIAGNEAVWQQQIEARAAQQQAALHGAHKPQTWQDIQQLLNRYNNCWQWTTNGERAIQHHLLIDTTDGNLEKNVQTAVDFIQLVAHSHAS
eukprot:GHRR01023716.1.p1 GENE.GHRR01023716.1~~GHRR01023716.1.p1  ORF type:complete len:199 (+),score=56.92 GHRR01023716.1:83-679(+)